MNLLPFLIIVAICIWAISQQQKRRQEAAEQAAKPQVTYDPGAQFRPAEQVKEVTLQDGFYIPKTETSVPVESSFQTLEGYDGVSPAVMPHGTSGSPKRAVSKKTPKPTSLENVAMSYTANDMQRGIVLAEILASPKQVRYFKPKGM